MAEVAAVPEAVREALFDAPLVAEALVESTVDPSAVTRDVSSGPLLGEEAGEGLDLEAEDWMREDRDVGDDMGGSPVAVASGWPRQTSGEPPQTE
ncbi:hypothetical protein MKX07_003380 [Trichoderma sp. CBMAI-0711]|nr:hypothetical protein MKX07_003380 [Trichoderma sp. CBMAI-0711]